MRTNIPSFRLPAGVLDEEVGIILGMGVNARFGAEITSLKALHTEGYDAIFVGTGAPKGKDLDIPGRTEAAANIHIGIDWLTSVAFGHVEKVGRRVVVIGGGNTAMDCCRTALRLGAEAVTVTVRSPRKVMKASDWEIKDALYEGIPILDNHAPKAFVLKDGKLAGVAFEKMVVTGTDAKGRPKLEASGELVTIECDDVLMAIGQENAFPWIERDIGIDVQRVGPCPPSIARRSCRLGPRHVLRRRRRLGAGEHHLGGRARPPGRDLDRRLLQRPQPRRAARSPGHTLISQKMGIHEWSYSNDYDPRKRVAVPHAEAQALAQEPESRSGTRLRRQARRASEAERCLNCDVQTVFTEQPVHRVRRVHGHLPGRLHQLHRQRRRAGPARGAARAGAAT